MGYTKNSWQSGDIITKAKLDNMEDGIAGAYPLVISVERGEDGDGDTTWTMNHTYAEIAAAIAAGRLAYVYNVSDQLQLVYDISNNTVSAYYFYGSNDVQYIAASEDDYPVRTVITP